VEQTRKRTVHPHNNFKERRRQAIKRSRDQGGGGRCKVKRGVFEWVGGSSDEGD